MKKAFIYLLLILFFGCKEKERNSYPNHYKNEVINTDSLKSTSNKDEFKNKLNNEPKIFLKFWTNMTEKEYSTVIDILNKEGKLKGNNYVSSEGLFQIEPIKRIDKIIGIRLSYVNNNLYKLYKEKYNLPPLKYKFNISEIYTEENPAYLKSKITSEDILKKGKKINTLSYNELLRNSYYCLRELPPQDIINNPPQLEYPSALVSLSLSNEFKIESDNSDIWIHEETEGNDDTMSAFGNENEQDYSYQKPLFLYKKINSYEDVNDFCDYDIVNSPQRIVIKYFHRNIKIDYYSKDYFEQEALHNEKRIKNENQQKNITTEKRNLTKDEI